MGKSTGRALKYFSKESECKFKTTGNEICMILDGFMVVSVYVNSFLNNCALNFCVGGYVWSMPTSLNMSAWKCYVPLIAKFYRHTFFD
jgi:hypothetical protein